MAAADRRERTRWAGTVAESLIFLSCVAFLVTASPWALIAWLVIGTCYLLGGFAAIWRGAPIELEAQMRLHELARWTWIPPVLAGTAGAASAITALVEKGSSGDAHHVMLTVASSLGVILSWALMQVGFAQMYLILDVTGDGEDVRFPDAGAPSVLSYLYFAFTLGTSFATSDVEIVTARVRRLALIHTVVAYFYNALVVAVAFQVLQGLVTQ